MICFEGMATKGSIQEAVIIDWKIKCKVRVVWGTELGIAHSLEGKRQNARMI